MAYDFHGEVLDKYPEALGPALFHVIGDIFAHLPLCTIIEEEAFIVHAGLPLDKEVTLTDIEQISRYGVRSCIRDAEEGVTPWQLNIIEGLLWSDPERDPGSGRRFNDKRNAGCFFGMEDVHEWLTANGLRYFVRSHECVPLGWEEWDSGKGTKLYTVFSASNYPRHEGLNKGAVLQFREGELPAAITFESEMEEPEFVNRSNQSLAELICGHKHLLHQAFQAKAGGRPAVSVPEWVEVMEDVLALHLDWAQLQKAIAPANKRGNVRYNAFLGQYQIQLLSSDSASSGGKASSSLDPTAVQALYRNQNQLVAVFRYLDSDHNGVIDREEFKAGVSVLNDKLGEIMDVESASDLFDVMDIDSNGEIDMNEFCECFRITRGDIDETHSRW